MSPKNASSRWPAKIETPSFSHDRLRDEARVVRGRARADVVRRRLAPREQLLVAPHRPALDRVAEERRPGRAAEAELVDDVRPRVARPVDVELVLRGRRERVVVRAGRRILTGDPVGDDRDRVRLVRAPERVQVGVVGARILRDQRRLAVTGGGAGARAGADDRSAERCDRDCSESGGRQCCLLHRSHTPVRGSWTALLRRSAATGSIEISGEPNPAGGRTGGVLAVASTVPMRSRDLAHLSDEALVALVARSDESALAELYDRVGGTAYGLAYRVLRDEALAEDAVQEAFLGLWRGAGSFIPERAKASTWILTLVHRRAVDLVRREQRRRAEPIEGAPGAGGRLGRGGGVAPARPRARPGCAGAAARPAARGDRARVLRRLHPVGARRAAGSAARHDQEPYVLGLDAPARAPRRRD